MEYYSELGLLVCWIHIRNDWVNKHEPMEVFKHDFSHCKLRVLGCRQSCVVQCLVNSRLETRDVGGQLTWYWLARRSVFVFGAKRGGIRKCFYALTTEPTILCLHWKETITYVHSFCRPALSPFKVTSGNSNTFCTQLKCLKIDGWNICCCSESWSVFTNRICVAKFT